MTQLSITIKKLYDVFKEHPELIGKVKVETRFGFYSILGCEITAHNSDVIEVKTATKTIKTSPKHQLYNPIQKWVSVDTLKIGDTLATFDGIEEVVSLKKMPKKEDLYDIEVEDKHEFYANGFVSHNSTLGEVAFYALYGESIGNKIKLPNLVNNINKKELCVSIKFIKDGIPYKIERGRKPNYLRFFKGEDELISDESQGDSRNTQEEIDKVLGISKELFAQTIILSCQVPIFLDQTTANQKIILEQILGVDVITDKINKLKEVIKETKNELNNEAFKIQTLKTQQETLKSLALTHYNDSVKNKEKWEVEHNSSIIKVSNEIESLKQIDFDKEIANINDYNNYALKLKEFNDYKSTKDKLTSDIINNNTNVEKYKVELNEIKQEDVESLLEAFKANELIAKEEQAYKLKEAEHKALMIKIKSLQTTYDTNKRRIDDVNKELETVKANLCPTCGQPINASEVESLKEGLVKKINDMTESNNKVQEDIDSLTKEYESFVEQTFSYKSTGKYSSVSTVTALQSKCELLEQRINDGLTAIADIYTKIQSLVEVSEPEKIELKSSYKTIDDVLKVKTSLGVLEGSLVKLVGEKNPFEEQVIKYKEEYESIDVNVDDSKVSELSIQQQHNETLLKLLNNPSSFVRKAILENSLDLLNSKIRYYLSKLGSLHTVSFTSEMDIEITQNGLEFGYVSSGEMGRISLALTFAFRDVWESLNNCKVNLLMIDEQLDRMGLDTNGVMMATQCIKSMEDKNIFIVSHNDSIVNQCPDIITIIKENGFSTIVS